MDIEKLVDRAIDLAKVLSPLVPALGQGAAIAQSVQDIFEHLGQDIPLDKQAEATAARQELRAVVADKIEREVRALRGEG